MSCEEIKILLSGMVDGELESGEKKNVSDHLVSCSACREEYAKLMKLKEVTDDMKYFDLPDRLWAGYWHGIYNRLERGIGWILLSIGVILILIFAAWRFLQGFLLDPAIPMYVKIGVSGLILGLIVLLVSIIRERL
ncbi:MAG: zf-HC2 domain-containing protein, partial [Candidatus Zixiibacteriota bacterium]